MEEQSVEGGSLEKQLDREAAIVTHLVKGMCSSDSSIYFCRGYAASHTIQQEYKEECCEMRQSVKP